MEEVNHLNAGTKPSKITVMPLWETIKTGPDKNQGKVIKSVDDNRSTNLHTHDY